MFAADDSVEPAIDGLVTPDGLGRHAFAAMGTTVTVLLPNNRRAEAAAVERLFRDWDRTCTRFEPTSELSRLNQAAGDARVVSDLLFDVLWTARRAAEATDGLFDPTLLRSLEAIGYDRDFASLDRVDGEATRELPADARLTEQPRPATRTGGWRDLELDPTRRLVRLPPGVGLDVGGLAKGMAVDAMIADLSGRGVAAAAVDAGGDLAVIGLPPDAGSWPIAIELPDGHETVSLHSGALATSSVARRRWRQGDVERHHLVDPRTGLPSTERLWSVSVAAPTCAQAEVAAKAAFLLGRDRGARFLAERGLSGRFVLPDGRSEPAGGWSAT